MEQDGVEAQAAEWGALTGDGDGGGGSTGWVPGSVLATLPLGDQLWVCCDQ